MSEFAEIFKDKKITVMGLGLLGRGIGDARFLARQGANLIVTDLKSRDALSNSVEELAEFSNITFTLGEHRLEDFENRDLILKAAGVPLDSIYIAHARKCGIPIDMSASLCARIARIPLIGVTGTRGKSTATHMLARILETAHMRHVLGGNVRGVSTLALLEAVPPDVIGIFELDSWQLQGFGEEKSLQAPGVRQGAFSPNISVFTTFMPDHLNYYQNDLDQYLADKANIFLHQNPDDTLVVGRQAMEIIKKKYGSKIASHVVVADETTMPKSWKLQILGEHNRYNAGCAIEAARALGIDDDIIREALENFRGVPGRLELLREVSGVKWYNDSNATTPEATIAALRALDTSKNIVLIVGGADKALDLSPLLEEINARAKSLILLPGTGTDKIDTDKLSVPFVKTSTLEEAVQEALSGAVAGHTILFSPGFASFGLFKNEYDRSDQFVALINKL